MYKAFYGLREKPFNLTPDPRFLYLSEKHKEAFAHLLYGIRSRSGFVMVTGEIGTGKTTICRNLLNQLDEDTEVAFIFNPMLGPLELLRKIVSEFGIDARGANALELTEELNEYLLEAAAKGKNCVLLIDEAQNLDPQVLEQIRLLSNLETETEKLLQIVLIGQPELGEKLELHELRQLNQRITARYHLRPLSDKEVMQYVAYRLHVAGGRRRVKFAKPAIRAVYKISKGTPRVINALCDRALLIGFTRETHTITKGIVHRAYREIRGDAVFGQQPRRWSFRQLALNPVSALIALCIATAIYLNSPTLQSAAGNLASRVSEALPVAGESAGHSGAGIAEAKTVEPAAEDPLLAAIIESSSAPAPPPAAEETTNPISAAPAAAETPAAPANDADSLLAALETAGTDPAPLMALLSAWDKEDDGASPPALGDDAALDRFFRDNGWSHDRLNPALGQLIALDLPALVKVVANGEAHWVSLLHADGDRLTVVASGDGPLVVDRAALESVYGAEAIVPWQDPAPGAPAMREGQASDAVARLKDSLRNLDRLRAENTSNAYDVETASAVARLQAETSLDVDGIAGPQVRMVLSSWLKDSGAPSLTGETPIMPERVAKQTPPKTPAAESKVVAAEEAPTASPEPEPAPVATPEPKPAPVATPKPSPAAPVEPEPEPTPEVKAESPQDEDDAAPDAIATEPEPVEPEPEKAVDETIAESTPEPVVDSQQSTEAAPGESGPESPAEEATATETQETVADDSTGATDAVVESADAPEEAEADTVTQPEETVAAEADQAVPAGDTDEPETAETSTESGTEAAAADTAPVTITNVGPDAGEPAGPAPSSESTPAAEGSRIAPSGAQLIVTELDDPGSLPPDEDSESESGARVETSPESGESSEG